MTTTTRGPVKALLVPADPGKATRILTVDQDTPKMFQQLVGGWIEAISTADSTWHAYCNEEGKIERLPLNARATRLARILGWDRSHRDVLCGDVVFLGDGPDGAEADVPDLVVGQMAMLESNA